MKVYSFFEKYVLVLLASLFSPLALTMIMLA